MAQTSDLSIKLRDYNRARLFLKLLHLYLSLYFGVFDENLCNVLSLTLNVLRFTAFNFFKTRHKAIKGLKNAVLTLSMKVFLDWVLLGSNLLRSHQIVFLVSDSIDLCPSSRLKVQELLNDVANLFGEGVLNVTRS